MIFHQPKNLKQAFDLRAATGFPVLAGGTDLIAQWQAGAKKPEGVIAIGNLRELAGIKKAGGQIQIGAVATHAGVYESKLVLKYFPALAEACRSVGAVQIQNRGTIGGNIMNASPAGDTLPALLAYDAKLELAGGRAGLRIVELKDFYAGYRKTLLKADEILTRILIPLPAPEEKAKFYKIGTRRTQAISKVCACFRAGEGGFRIAFGSVAATPVRCCKTEKFLQGRKINPETCAEAMKTLEQEISPITDIRSTDLYRKAAALALLERFLLDM